ncbi:MAG: rhodanese-like domain-containing protein [Magnetococcales bacterium]|nr:rhodanese-like domain-containing protein [Magnetococcales bacterium]
MLEMNEDSLQWIAILMFMGFILRAHVFSRILGVEKLTVHELMEKLGANPPIVLIDVRTKMEFDAGHAKGARLVPLNELKKRVEEVKQMCPHGSVAVVCRSGNRSLSGTVILKRAGIEHVYNVSGGMIHWQSQGYPVRK